MDCTEMSSIEKKHYKCKGNSKKISPYNQQKQVIVIILTFDSSTSSKKVKEFQL